MKVNTKIEQGRAAILIELKRLIEKGAVVELKEIKDTRTSQQNRALHLFFTHVSETLNDHGIEFSYQTGITGNNFDIPWSAEMVKEYIWRPLQKVITKKKSTTKLTKVEIDPIFDIICRSLANKGIEVSFPNSFDYYLNHGKL